MSAIGNMLPMTGVLSALHHFAASLTRKENIRRGAGRYYFPYTISQDEAGQGVLKKRQLLFNRTIDSMKQEKHLIGSGSIFFEKSARR
jgi:hypothetical protein